MKDLYYEKFKNNILKSIMSSIKLEWKNPSNYLFYLKCYQHQKKAAKLRQKNKADGLNVPPIAIFSITNRCNLNCKGCYANAQNRDFTKELEDNKIKEIFLEAMELGVSIIMLAGGEPLLRKNVLRFAGEMKNILFPVFTNSTLINSEMVKFFKKNKNVIPILSIEGYQEQTDRRRGSGVFNRVLQVADKLNHNNIHFGTSLTLTSENYETLLNDEFIRDIVNQGSKLNFFVEFVPQNNDQMGLCLSPSQKAKLSQKLMNYENEYGGIFSALPGNEEQYGGCLAAGRGFVHISSEGNVEPCPFTPYSDCSLSEISLKEALQSGFLKKLQNNHDRLTESKGGCTLWENREWVKKQLI